MLCVLFSCQRNHAFERLNGHRASKSIRRSSHQHKRSQAMTQMFRPSALFAARKQWAKDKVVVRLATQRTTFTSGRFHQAACTISKWGEELSRGAPFRSTGPWRWREGLGGNSLKSSAGLHIDRAAAITQPATEVPSQRCLGCKNRANNECICLAPPSDVRGLAQIISLSPWHSLSMCFFNSLLQRLGQYCEGDVADSHTGNDESVAEIAEGR